MFEGAHAPPFYLDLYGFNDGSQDDIFEDSQIPTFNSDGVQTGFTTRGKDTATLAVIATPSGTSFPTTTSAPPAQATQNSSGGNDAASSSVSVSASSSAPTSASPSSGKIGRAHV